MRRALVCGSSKGIGKAVAKTLAAKGYEVVLMARKEEVLREVLKELDVTAGQKHDFISADFQSPDSVHKAIHQYLEKNPRGFDILLNNTGGPAAGPASDAGIEQFRLAFNQHLICNHILVQALLPAMKERGFGRIINMISTSVKIPLKGLGVSNSIRGAVANWSKTLANELAVYGITVNNVLPGATKTERLEEIIQGKSNKAHLSLDEVEKEMLSEIPMGRFARPEEIAAAVAFLASDEASYITGINIPVDGGRTGSL